MHYEWEGMGYEGGTMWGRLGGQTRTMPIGFDSSPVSHPNALSHHCSPQKARAKSAFIRARDTSYFVAIHVLSLQCAAAV